MKFNGIEVDFLSGDADHTFVIAKNAPNFHGVMGVKYFQSDSIFKNPKNSKIQINDTNVNELVPESIRMDLPYFHEGLFNGWSIDQFEEDLKEKVIKKGLKYCASIDKEFSDFFDTFESQ